MTAMKGLALAAALIVGTSSVAMAQAQGSSGPHGQPATDNPSSPRTVRRHDTKHHFPRMFMSAPGEKGTPKTSLPNGGY
jgi:hypothetical protein